MKFDFEHPPPEENLSPLAFCEFCEALLRQNPDIRPETCMHVNDDERWIREPFTLSEKFQTDKVAEQPPPWPES